MFDALYVSLAQSVMWEHYNLQALAAESSAAQARAEMYKAEGNRDVIDVESRWVHDSVLLDAPTKEIHDDRTHIA